MIRLTVSGKTFNIKEELRQTGFRWNPQEKNWYQNFNESDTLALKWADYYDSIKGISTKVETPNVKEERKYRVKESWIFNLESMHDKLWCLEYDIQEGNIECPFKVAGRIVNDEGDLYDLRNEAEELEYAAKSGKVTGTEYGRIREIVAWRVEARYATCLANGMDEAKAGQCFEDM